MRMITTIIIIGTVTQKRMIMVIMRKKVIGERGDGYMCKRVYEREQENNSNLE